MEKGCLACRLQGSGRDGFAMVAWAAALAALVPVAGCGSKPPPQEPAPPQAGREEVREEYFVHYLDGSRVGRGRTTIRPLDEDGSILHIEGATTSIFARFGEPLEQTIRFTSRERADDGTVLEYSTEMDLGPTPVRAQARLEDGSLVVVAETEGHTSQTSIPWREGDRGFLGIEQSLREEPMAPGESRTVRCLEPSMNEMIQVRMAAAQWEDVRLPARRAELLRVEAVFRGPDGLPVAMTHWTDREGRILKSRFPAMGLEVFSATREEALAEFDDPLFDVGMASVVPVRPPAASAHTQPVMQYRVRLRDEDPVAVFPAGPTQEVRHTGDREAEITVRAVRGDEEPAEPPAEEPPGEGDLAANHFVQSDAPRIREMAARIAPAERDPWRLAVALEQFVHEHVAEKNLSHSFATAVEVAEMGEGDCTEHAVLLAALARARGIPARAVIGLVYVESQEAFAYHMWNEVYVADRWVPLDGTLGRGGIGAGHLKLAHSDLPGTTALPFFLPVTRLLGQLEVEVVSPEPENEGSP